MRNIVAPEIAVVRPRPDYAVPDRMLRAFEKGFPKGNAFTCSTGVSVKWSRTRWARPEFDLTSVQCRQVFAAFYDTGALIGAANFFETRNPFDEEVPSLNYLFDCDASSEMLLHHSTVALQAVEELLGGSAFLHAKESFAEISALWIQPEAKSRLLWVEPLNELIQQLYAKDENCSVVVLKPFPLEYVDWRNREDRRWACNELVDRLQGRGAVEQGEAETRARHLECRRIKALCQLYAEQLGFCVITRSDTVEPWMARVPY